MRALLAGISGVNKDIVVANLLGRLRAHGEVNVLSDPSVDATAPRELVAASIEDTLAAQGNELAGVLAAFRPAYQLAAWQRAGLEIAERLEAAGPAP